VVDRRSGQGRWGRPCLTEPIKQQCRLLAELGKHEVEIGEDGITIHPRTEIQFDKPVPYP
jgi:hypothetical protein